MRTYDIIYKKRNGKELNEDEINYFIQGYTYGHIPDYQAAALIMAIFFRGMSKTETANLTLAMAKSGEMIDLGRIKGKKVDKHSTGGVGDKTTLIVGPMVAALGVPVAKMSGPGLGHTGGTLDKLKSIPGMKVEMTREEFIESVNQTGIALAGQTGNLAPADKKIYVLRDVIAAVESMPLIASSIMSKKLAAGADAIVLDVKTGSGALIGSLEEAIELAQTMVAIGEELGRQTVAVITSMEQPLGMAIGNSLEVIEAIETLAGRGPKDLEDICLILGAHMLVLAGKTDRLSEAIDLLRETISSGTALEKFRQMVKNQGGLEAVVDDIALLNNAKELFEVCADEAGFIERIDAKEIGLAAMMLGAGREKKEDVIDYQAGILLRKKIGDYASAREVLAVLFSNHPKKINELTVNKVLSAFKFCDSEPPKLSLVKAVVTKEGIQHI